jgi:hypothetical protein
MMERKSRSKKTLSLKALERQRRKPSLSPSHRQFCHPNPNLPPSHSAMSHSTTTCATLLNVMDGFHLDNLKDLYIRESYRTIASGINPGINKTIITGTPGIGKSLFLMYLLWKLVKEGKRVLFIYHPFNIYYDGQGGVFMLDKIPSPLLPTPIQRRRRRPCRSFSWTRVSLTRN